MNMRGISFSVTFAVSLLASHLSLRAESKPQAKIKSATAIIGGINTGERLEKQTTPRKPRAYRVKNTTTRRQANGQRVTIQEVEQPAEDKIARKQQRSELAERNNPKQPGTAAAQTAEPAPETIILAAEVSGKSKEAFSHLTLWHNGTKTTAVTRADFRLMDGFTRFKANGRHYFIIQSITEAAEPQNNKRQANKPSRRIPSGTFRITSADTANPAARRIFRDLHTLYQKEKSNLTAAFHKREANKRLHAKNPPPPRPPKPVTIRFWKRDLSAERGASK